MSPPPPPPGLKPCFKRKTNTVAMVALVTGGLVVLVVAAVALWVWRAG